MADIVEHRGSPGRRRSLGLAVFNVIVVAVPLLLWPALGTGTFSDVFEDL